MRTRGAGDRPPLAPADDGAGGAQGRRRVALLWVWGAAAEGSRLSVGGGQRQLRHLTTAGRALVHGGACKGARAFTCLLSPQCSSRREKTPSLPSASTLRGHGQPGVWPEQPDVSDRAPAPGDTEQDTLGRAEVWPCLGVAESLEPLVSCAGVDRCCPHRGRRGDGAGAPSPLKGWSGRACAPAQWEAAAPCRRAGAAGNAGWAPWMEACPRSSPPHVWDEISPRRATRPQHCPGAVSCHPESRERESQDDSRSWC